MKKFLIAVLFVMFILYSGLPVAYGALRPTKPDAQHVINRTAAVILTAQRFAIQGQKYEGLGLAVAHQVYALELFKRSIFPQAIFHSLRARVLAAQVKSELFSGALYDRMEEKYAQETPSDRELDQKLKEAKMGIPNDQTAANTDVELDVE